MFKFLKSTPYTKTTAHLGLVSATIALLITSSASYGAGPGNTLQNGEEISQWTGLTVAPFNVSSQHLETQINTLNPTFAESATQYNILLTNITNAVSADESVDALNALLAELREDGHPRTLRRDIPAVITLIPGPCPSHTLCGRGYNHADAQALSVRLTDQAHNEPGVDHTRISTWVEPKLPDAVALIPIFGWVAKVTHNPSASCRYYHLANYAGCGIRIITTPAQTITRDLTPIVDAVSRLKDELNVYISQREMLAAVNS